MNERRLIKISFLVSILGVFLLLLISFLTPLQQVNNYSDLKLNNYVKTSGRIISISQFEDFAVIKLYNNITITCNCQLKESQTIQVEGKVTEYQNQLQIQADRLEVVENVP